MIQPIIDHSGIIHIFKGKQSEPIKLLIGEVITAEIMDIFPTGTIQLRIKDRIINAQPQRELPLNRGDTVMVKVEKPLEDGTIPLRLLSAYEEEQLRQATLQFDRDFSEKLYKLLESVFAKNIYSSKEISQSQMDMIKNMLTLPMESISETQKTSLIQKIMDFFTLQKGTAENLDELIRLLEKNNFPKEQISLLKNSIILELQELNPEKLKEVLLNSGVSFEVKMKQALFDSNKIEKISEDLKVILTQITKEAKAQGFEEIAFKAEQILRQIETYQILSKTYQSFFTFLPIFLKDIEGGNIAYKSLKREGKDYHSIFVSLNFKEESLSFVVTMINKSFFVNFSGNPEILSEIKQREVLLKEQFQNIGLTLNGINYISKIEDLIKHWHIKEGSVSLTV
ncbi:MAG: hypothetical protein RMI30_08040 [Thermodesulfovibrio sp.]|nr:hypothetical protein [Thermodesulfovibrio sp.]MDW7999371.1 hypothetical protein [Thermodesulfovibrio sp.]